MSAAAERAESPPEARKRPAGIRPLPELLRKNLDTTSVDQPTDCREPSRLEVACNAHVIVVVVLTDEDKQSRRVYLSLDRASQAVRRATAKGHSARMVLCSVTPVPGALSADGRWSE